MRTLQLIILGGAAVGPVLATPVAEPEPSPAPQLNYNDYGGMFFVATVVFFLHG